MYCNFCKKETEHNETEKNKFVCVNCGSSRIGLIQGMNANLM